MLFLYMPETKCMPKIKQLSLHEAHKIAAGEVIERPANIVKELLENALDAQATHIVVELKNGGKDLIRITDNGYGMDSIDARLCFGKYATSKITHMNELPTITTFGFRGEALASVAAVSTIKLTTKEPSAVEGIQLIITESALVHEQPMGCSSGTTLEITELFNTIPARKKFLKTVETEYRQILYLFQAFCLAYPAIHFTLIHDTKTVLNCPGVDTLTKRYTQLWDYALAEQMILIDHHDATLRISGLISQHQRSRYDRNGIFLFVNNRWVKNSKLVSALLQGYASVLPAGQFPYAALAITLESTQLDINVHPRKEEVQFLHPRIIETCIQAVVKKTLEKELSAQLKKTIILAKPAPIEHLNNTQKQYSFAEKQPFNPFPAQSFIQEKTIPKITEPVTLIAAAEQKTIKQENINIIPELPLYRIIGQFDKTYIILEQDDGLFLIDQHAAHERVLYELFSNRFHELPLINLLFPQIITVDTADIKLIIPHVPLFQKNGIMLDVIGENQLSVQSIAVHLKNIQLEALIRQIIGWIIESHHLDTELFEKELHEKMHAQMACKAAIKAGDELTQEAMQQLLYDLYKTTNRFTCPHGRPTGYLMSTQEIEKKFKRDYKRNTEN